MAEERFLRMAAGMGREPVRAPVDGRLVGFGIVRPAPTPGRPVVRGMEGRPDVGSPPPAMGREGTRPEVAGIGRTIPDVGRPPAMTGAKGFMPMGRPLPPTGMEGMTLVGREGTATEGREAAPPVGIPGTAPPIELSNALVGRGKEGMTAPREGAGRPSCATGFARTGIANAASEERVKRVMAAVVDGVIVNVMSEWMLY